MLMRRRLYFVLPDVGSARSMLNEMLLARIECRHIHFLSRRDSLPGDLPEANVLQKTDIVHGAQLGIAIGAFVGAAAGGLLVLFPPEGVTLQLLTILIIAVGGAVFGAWVARPLREGVGIYPMFLVAAALLIVAAVITNLVDARERRRTEAAVPDVMTSGTLPAATPQLRAATGEFKAAGADYRTASGTLKAVTREDVERLRAGQEPASEPRRGAFGLVFTNQYLLLVAFMILLLNWVNSNGGYLLNRMLRSASAEEVVAFNSGYLTTINLLGMFLQLFVVSRVIKHAGVRLALMVLPVIALAGNSIMAIMPMLAAVRWAKTFENATDYSLMNTLRHVLFLPTTREEKYAAKQVIDSFMVRLGDVLSAGLVALGTSVVVLSTRQFAMINVVLVLAWLVLAWAVGRRYERLSAVTA